MFRKARSAVGELWVWIVAYSKALYELDWIYLVGILVGIIMITVAAILVVVDKLVLYGRW